MQLLALLIQMFAACTLCSHKHQTKKKKVTHHQKPPAAFTVNKTIQ